MDIEHSLFFSYGGWSWLVAGLLLMAFELMVPGGAFLWFGVAALVTGAATSLFGLAWQAQLILFAVASAASLLIWRALPRRVVEDKGDPALNRRAARHIGRRFVLTEPIVAGSGRVKLDDTVWRVAGPDCPAGTAITVKGVDGSILLVEQAS